MALREKPHRWDLAPRPSARCVHWIEPLGNVTAPRTLAIAFLLVSLILLPQLAWSGEQKGGETREAQFERGMEHARGTQASDGNVIAPNYIDAAQMFRKAADRGLASAQRSLADLYWYGLGVKKDEAEAVKWWKKAADQGDSKALTSLGNAYALGVGVKKNEAEAAKRFRRAANLGDPPGQLALGMMYASGRGVKGNAAEAVKWYRESAEQGHPLAQYALGVAYEIGFGGLTADKDVAAQWFSKAAAQGLDPAKTAAERTAGNQSPLQLPGDAVRANLIAMTDPVYPPQARAEGIQDFVMFHALIDGGGRVKDLKIVHGHPLLNDAAMESVKQWRYAPLFLSGQPIEVSTVITLNFRFDRP